MYIYTYTYIYIQIYQKQVEKKKLVGLPTFLSAALLLLKAQEAGRLPKAAAPRMVWV